MSFKQHVVAFCVSCAFIACAQAQEQYLSCNVTTSFHRPAPMGTEWVHQENNYTKVFKLDSSAQSVAIYNRRSGDFTPICHQQNKACEVSWRGNNIHVDATGGPDNPVPPYLDFRRSFDLDDSYVTYVLSDYGNNGDNAPISNLPADEATMSWVFEGVCQKAEAPEKPTGRPPMGRVGNPDYVDAGPAFLVDQEEADQVMAGYYGNTMWGYSGGGHWFHMWFLGGFLAYMGDDEDMSAVGEPVTFYVGKDSSGYRMCLQEIPEEGRSGCYPLPKRSVGESWVQQDMDGPAYFSLLPGRQ